MIKDCRVRRSDKSLFKTELSILFKKKISIDQNFEEIHPRKLQVKLEKIMLFRLSRGVF